MNAKRERWSPSFLFYSTVVVVQYAVAVFLFWILMRSPAPLFPWWGWGMVLLGFVAIGFVLWRQREGELRRREEVVEHLDEDQARVWARETEAEETEERLRAWQKRLEEQSEELNGWERRHQREEKDREDRRLAEIGVLQDLHEPYHEWFLLAMHWYENNRPTDEERRRLYVARNIDKFLNDAFQNRTERAFLERGDARFSPAGRERLAIYARDHWKDEFTRAFHIGELYAIITDYWEFDYKCVLLARQMGEELKDVPEKLARYHYPEAEGLYFKDKEEAQRRLQAKVEEARRVCIEDCWDLIRRNVAYDMARQRAIKTFDSRILAYQEAADDQQVEIHVPEDPLAGVDFAE